MTAEPTNAEKLRLLPWGIGFFATNAVWFYLTFFGSAFVLFLNKLGLEKTEIGSLLSLLPFSGLIALFITPLIDRWGYKRTFFIAYTGRIVFSAFLLPTPWVLSRFGPQGVLSYITGVVIVFGICRAFSLTALLPWQQEFVPDAVRGKFAAVNNIFVSIAGFMAITAGSYLLGSDPTISRFIILFGIGCGFGLGAIWLITFIPGGAPAVETRVQTAPWSKFREAAGDPNFRRYLFGVGLITLVAGPLVSFLPLFMQEQGGLDSGKAVLLQAGTTVGGLLSSYLWGWAADRYGSVPVMLSGVSLRALLPISWMLMPRHSIWTLYVAFGIAFFQGWADLAWSIGSGRLLYTSVVPPEKRTNYMALYYAWISIVGGGGQLLGGFVLGLSTNISGRFLFLAVDPYTVLFAMGLVLTVAGGFWLRGVGADSDISARQFTGMLVRGNPFMALASLVRYHRAKDERATVITTADLGRTESPLTENELLEALADPRFNVRFEAIVSMARRKPTPRLIEALVKVLTEGEPALSVMSAWALGRIGDQAALGALREGMNARYRSVRAHSARSLGNLGDREIIPALLEGLTSEQDSGLRVAYAAALGKLGVEAAADRLLLLLRSNQNQISRQEFALALARIIGDEYHFIQLVRASSADPGPAIARALIEVRAGLEDLLAIGGDVLVAVDGCVDAFARNEVAGGAQLLSRVIRVLPGEILCPTSAMILRDCAERFDEFEPERIEYVVLAVHALRVNVEQGGHRTHAWLSPT